MSDKTLQTIQNDKTPKQRTMIIEHLSQIDSTQDEVRRRITNPSFDSSSSSSRPFAISSSYQTNGRGTNGRTWFSEWGNCFVTIAVPFRMLQTIEEDHSNFRFPISLLPLKMSTIVSNRLHSILSQSSSSSKVSVKWPNDVLVNNDKIAGILIESATTSQQHQQWLLIGIGINVASAPHVNPIEKKDGGRQSTCLAHYTDFVDYQKGECEDDSETIMIRISRELANDISHDIYHWLSSSSSNSSQMMAKDIVDEWSNWADWGMEQVLRDDAEERRRRVVIPLSIEPDGRLRVRCKVDGEERLLCTDYLF